MAETIRSYIDKNLTNLNWNILPQIFESEGVELTEEIERYLRETPKNTNWNVFGSLGNNSEEKTDFKIINMVSNWDTPELMPPGSSWETTIEAWQDCILNPTVLIKFENKSLVVEGTSVPGAYGPPTIHWIFEDKEIVLEQSFISIQNN